METDVVIAVMGVTGAGKSSFIKNITKREDIQIGHGLTSETSEVTPYVFEGLGRRYVLVDTPGFNDTFESDQSITEKILGWLEASYRAGTKLSGILYLHSIANPRMSGSAFDNLCMFRKLCGNDCLSSVILATTFWDTVLPAEADDRVKKLKEDRLLWGRMVEAGSQIVQLHDDQPSAFDVLSRVSRDVKIVLQAQKEMVDEGKTSGQTAAAQFAASCGAGAGIRQHETHMEQLRARARQRSEHLHNLHEQLSSKDEQLKLIQEEAKRTRQSLEAKQKRIQKSHRCRCRISLHDRARCTGCNHSIGKSFFHCCYCTSTTGRTFFHCSRCGNDCGVLEHPEMARQEVYCVVM
ncbi:P-loop containing nucleoside triphosphate hydrolase protein [Paraphoma chrysanthemicola]|uniref:P-loop containing nucleoside triphosphate hydrolase protein n=1 Tax=Paraphoma chrysanthemicola TaxID=798071 RepID=A0A8K0RJ82_9PLEO|nr:P-loop containing nucleoside triphosphate hydrolase protein [Paraphoma chrysanthemicola]